MFRPTLVHSPSGLLIAPATAAADATVSAAVNIPMKVAVIISQVLSMCGLGTTSVRIPAYPLFRLRTVNSHPGCRNPFFSRTEPSDPSLANAAPIRLASFATKSWMLIALLTCIVGTSNSVG